MAPARPAGSSSCSTTTRPCSSPTRACSSAPASAWSGASSGADVAHLLGHAAIDVVVSDIAMPGMDGTEVLRMVHERDPDLPVILMTGAGDFLRSAAKAVELRAMRYLLKPVDFDLLVETVTDAAQQREATTAARRTLELVDLAASARRDLSARLNRALTSVHLVHQPIVNWRERQVFAHEALVRSSEPTLSDPTPLLAAAEQLAASPTSAARSGAPPPRGWSAGRPAPSRS